MATSTSKSKTKVYFDNLGRPTAVVPGADYAILQERAERKAAEEVQLPSREAMEATTARVRRLTACPDLVIDWLTPVAGGPEALLAQPTLIRAAAARTVPAGPLDIPATSATVGRWALKLGEPVICGQARDQIRVRWQVWALVPGFPSRSGKIWVSDSSSKFCRLNGLGEARVKVRVRAGADVAAARAAAGLEAQKIATLRAARAVWELLDRASRRALRAG